MNRETVTASRLAAGWVGVEHNPSTNKGSFLNRYGVFNRGLRKLTALEEFLGGTVEPVYFRTPVGLTATLGWGRRKYARRARRVAQAKGIPFLCLEDGFLRSVGLGSTEPPLSIVVDDLGIYYDATHPSRLDSLIARPLTGRETARARAIIMAWRNGRVSKYNYAPDHAGDLPERYVLVVDQTWGPRCRGRQPHRARADYRLVPGAAGGWSAGARPPLHSDRPEPVRRPQSAQCAGEIP